MTAEESLRLRLHEDGYCEDSEEAPQPEPEAPRPEEEAPRPEEEACDAQRRSSPASAGTPRPEEEAPRPEEEAPRPEVLQPMAAQLRDVGVPASSAVLLCDVGALLASRHAGGRDTASWRVHPVRWSPHDNGSI